MKKCIFCLTTLPTKFNTVEHILPESLGSDDWAILPDGLFCDDCQNFFGSTIEQQALADNPFILMRTLMGIPTKKKKAPWFKSIEGTIYSKGAPGQIEYQPNDFFLKSKELKNKIHTIVPLSTKKPEMLLRTLIKIGLETIAANDRELVFENRFDAARNYALTGKKNSQWFYVQSENDNLRDQYIKGEDWEDNHIFMDVHYEDNGLVFMHIRVYYIEFLVPLIENVEVDPKDDIEKTSIIVYV